MAETDEVISVRKRHDALRIDLRHGEAMLQNITDTVSKLSLEVVEDEVWEGFTDWVNFVLEVVAQDDIREAKVCCWPVRHMTDDQAIWLTSCLMYHDQVCEVVSLADLH